MATIDDKVVAMSFENSKFEAGVRTTMASIEKLKQSLNFTGAGKGLSDLSTSMGRFNRTNFRPLNKSIDSVRAHFSAANVIMGAALGHLTIQAVNFAERFTKALTLGPIIQGMDIYKTKLQAIQTILANTQTAGTNIQDVTKALNELNVFANKTIFSFGEMTRNIGTFTAAGVALKPAVAAIKGIANLAALSGSNSEQASTAMYQLSQAISAGRVSLQDWNSVVNAGMGGSVFQRALAQTAVAMGKIPAASLKLVGPMKNVQVAGESFRQSIQAGPGKTSWLTSDVLTNTLSQFTGDLTDAQLAAQGFNKAQIAAIQQTAKTALNAATQVKTFSQLMDVTKESIATGWSQSFELIIGNLNEAKKLFTDISNAMSGVINQSANSRNKILKDWKQLGGRTVLIKALKEVFQALGDVLRPIKDAFRDIFPRKTGKDLFDLTVRFKAFADTLKPSQETIDNLRRTFRGVFAVIDIGKQVIVGIIGVFERLFHVVGGGHGGFLSFTANIGDMLVAFDLALRKGKGLEHFFNGLTAVLAVPLKLFRAVAHAIANMFAGFSPGDFSVQMDVATKATEPFKRALDFITNALQGLGPAISNAIQNMNFELILQVIRTGLLAGLVLIIRKFLSGGTLAQTLGIFGNNLGKGLGAKIGGGLLKNLGGTFGQLTGTLKTMQQNLKAKTLEEIAIAIALIAASVVALSLVKPKRLSGALTALAIGFGELIGAMVVMDKLTTGKSLLKLPIIAASLILVATALDLLTISVVALGKLKPGELIRGLSAVAIILGTLVGAMKLLAKNSVAMAITGAALNEIAVALNIIALAVLQFGKMNLVTLGKGLLGIGGALVAIAIGMKLMPKGLIFTSTSMVILSVALNALALAVKQFGSMNLVTMGKGLLGIAGALVAIAIGMKLMPKGLIFTSTSMVILAAALNGFALALKQMGGMSIGEIAKSLITLAGALTILLVAMRNTTVSVVGAAAFLVIATSIGILAAALTALSRLSIGQIVKSLTVLAATFTIIGVAANLLSESIPALLGFGAALILIGTGIALTGAGIALIGVGLSAIAVSGSAAVAVLIKALIDLSKSLGEIGKNTILGLLEIVKAFAKVAPQFVKAVVKIIDTISVALIKSAPKMAEALVVVLVSALKSLDKHSPEIIKAGFDILENLLKGIRDNIGEIVTLAADLVINLVESLAKNSNRLLSAGFDMVVSLIQGFTNNINKLVSAGANAIIHFVTGIAKNIKKVTHAGLTILGHLLTGLGKDLHRFVKAGGDAIASFITGIGEAVVDIVKAAGKAGRKFVHAIVNQMIQMEDTVARGLVRLLNRTADIIDKYEPQIIRANARIGLAIVTGMVKGVGLNAHLFYDKIKSLAKSAWDHLKHFWKIFSPSKLTEGLGKNIVLGMAQGLDRNAHEAYSSVKNLNATMSSLMDTISLGSIDKNPRITPILDLSSIRQNASKLDGIINKTPLGAISLNHAAVISARQTAASTEKEAAVAAAGHSFKFEQNNFSPRELPASEIYRQTKNQLSQFRDIADSRKGV